MQNSVALSDDVRARLNAAYRTGIALGRKFESTDMTVELRLAARQYAATYEGDFPYMVEMRAAVADGGAFLSEGQAKGVLNCLMADARRRIADRAPKTVEAAVAETPAREVPLGTFTVVFPDGHVTIRLQKPQDKSKAGVVYAKYLVGQNNDTDFEYFASVVDGNIRARGYERQVVALKVVLTSTGSELGAMGLAYALASSNCFYCGRTLTVPASIHSGMGPDCAAKHGGDYSEPEAPVASEPAEEPVIEGEDSIYGGDVAPAAYIPREYKEDPALTADRERFAANKARAEAEGRKLTYEDIFFGEDDL